MKLGFVKASVEEAAKINKNLSKAVKLLKAKGYLFVAGAGVLIGVALDAFEDAGQVENAIIRNKKQIELDMAAASEAEAEAEAESED